MFECRNENGRRFEAWSSVGLAGKLRQICAVHGDVSSALAHRGPRTVETSWADRLKEATTDDAGLFVFASFLKFDMASPDEARAMLDSSRDRARPDVFAREETISWDHRGLDGAFLASGKVCIKCGDAFPCGARLDSIVERRLTGVEAMAELKAHGLTYVTPEHEDGGGTGTLKTEAFAAKGSGAVFRACLPGLVETRADFESGNWARHLPPRARATFEPKLLLIHAPFVTKTHRDNVGVWAWVKTFAGLSIFLVWSLEDGERLDLTDATPDDAWTRRGAWRSFFSMPSARLLVLQRGDFAVLRAGAYHRVFTLETKVVAYGDYFCAGGFEATLASVRRDERPHELGVDDVLLAGLKHAAKTKPQCRRLLEVYLSGTTPAARRRFLQTLLRPPAAVSPTDHAHLLALVNAELKDDRPAIEPNVLALAKAALDILDFIDAPAP